MNPDIFFLVGLVVLVLALPATISAFSTSGRTFRPVIMCILIGGGMVVFAMSQTPGGYTANDIPRILGDLFG